MGTYKTKIKLSIILAGYLIFNSSSALAVANAPVTKVVINEIQTNSLSSAGEEFVELKNIGNTTVDLTGWKLENINSVRNINSAIIFVTIPTNTVLYPGGYLLISPQDYLIDYSPRIFYNASFGGVAYPGGTVTLLNSNNEIVDKVGWGPDTPISCAVEPILCETQFALAPEKGASIERIINDGLVIDTNNNKNDFEKLAVPTPQTENIEPALNNSPADTEPPSDLPADPPADIGNATDLPVDDGGDSDTSPPTETPADNTGVDTTGDNTNLPTDAVPGQGGDNQTPVEEVVILPILLNELLIDPGDPLADATDEFVEVYNPNDQAVDLFGYTIFTGSNFTYKHTFADHTGLEPHAYLSLTSGDTSISLANSGGAAKIVGSNGQIFDQTTYTTAKTDVAWAKDESGQWQWTTIPTKDATNLITQIPEVINAAKSSAAVQKAVKTTAAKTTSTTAAKSTAKTASTTKVKAATDIADSPALVAAPTPMPVWLLAVLGILAVIYAGYEYRFDLANKIYQLRQYRGSRSPNR